MTLFLALAFFIAGAVVASFVGVLSERLYTGQSWMRDRSRCNSCRTELGVFDLIPVLSWILARGRCRHCGSRVPGLYATVETVLGGLFAAAYLTLGLTLGLALFLVALSVLMFIVLYDLRHTVVPASASMLLLAVSILYALYVSPDLYAFGTTSAGAGIIAFGFFLLYALSRGRAMGLGDTPVALALSFLVGVRALPGLVFSFWIGALFGIILLSVRRGGPRMGIEVPFVPFLAIGYLLAFWTTWNPFAFAG